MDIDIIGLLSTDGYIMCNKEIIRLYGTDCAVLIGELCAEYKYFQIKGELVDNMFFSTQDNIEQNTGLSAHCQREAIKKLKEAGIIDVRKAGMPARNYFYINQEQLCKIFMSSHSKIEPQVVQNLNLNNNKNNNKEKEDIIHINMDNIEAETSDFESHSYSKEELKDDFLGSAKKKPKTKRKSLYDKCVEAVYDYTANLILQDKLVQYLSVRLAIKEKPIYGVNQWKGLLNRLSKIEGDKVQIVEQSIEKGWCSFYEIKNTKSFSEGDGIYSVESEDTSEERQDKLRKQGKRSTF